MADAESVATTAPLVHARADREDTRSGFERDATATRPAASWLTQAGTGAFGQSVVDHNGKRLSQAVLRIEGHSVPFRGSAIVPTILFFLSRALKRCLPVYTRAFLEWTTLAPSAECGHRSRIAFSNPCAALSCPSWSESPSLSWSTRRSWRCCIRARPIDRLPGRAQGQVMTLWA